MNYEIKNLQTIDFNPYLLNNYYATRNWGLRETTKIRKIELDLESNHLVIIYTLNREENYLTASNQTNGQLKTEKNIKIKTINEIETSLEELILHKKLTGLIKKII